MKKMLLTRLPLIILVLIALVFTQVPALGQNKNLSDTIKQDTSIYASTMHPEIQSGQLGKCPKCGMELVKKNKTAGMKNKKQSMKTMCPIMNGMSNIGGMENNIKNDSTEKNKITSDFPQKEVGLYTCSMHPEIQYRQPGICPKCEMTLIKESTKSGKKQKHHKMLPVGIGMGIMMTGMLFFMIGR